MTYPPSGPPGSQPPQYQPPAHGQQPPAYGSQPAAYGSQPSAYGSQPPTYGAQPAQPSGRSGRGRLLLAAVAGFVVAAVIGAVLVATGVAHFGSSSGPSTAPLSMPASLGAYVRFSDARVNQQERAAQAVAYRRGDDARTAQELSAAHAGAAAAVQSYADQKLLIQFSVWAVRDETPRPVVFDVTAKESGTAQPYKQVKKIGSAYCELTTTKFATYGSKPPPNSQVASLCQRSEPGLTVSIVGGSPPLFNHPSQVVALLDEAWAQLH